MAGGQKWNPAKDRKTKLFCRRYRLEPCKPLALNFPMMLIAWLFVEMDITGGAHWRLVKTIFSCWDTMPLIFNLEPLCLNMGVLMFPYCKQPHTRGYKQRICLCLPALRAILWRSTDGILTKELAVKDGDSGVWDYRWDSHAYSLFGVWVGRNDGEIPIICGLA